MSAIEEKFWAKVDRAGERGCWEWTGHIKPEGYGQFVANGSKKLAHRVAYELVNGPIPEGLVIDHLCRNRACVNPDHLEPVTQRENVLRGLGITAKLAQRTHCANGHELTDENIYHWAGDNARRCQICRLSASRRYIARTAVAPA